MGPADAGIVAYEGAPIFSPDKRLRRPRSSVLTGNGDFMARWFLISSAFLRALGSQILDGKASGHGRMAR